MRLIFTGMICVLGMLVGYHPVAAAQPYHRLTAADFAGAPERNSASIAYTYCNIDYNYHVHSENGNYQLTFDIRLNIDKSQSWLDKRRISSRAELEDVLKHEQGHYIIAYMEQQELMRTVVKTRFDSDYKRRAQQLFDRIDAKYQQLNKDYDDDTAHMTNRVQQQSWDKYFQQKLEYMPPVQG